MMRITEGQLRQIIREELESGGDPVDRMMELDPWTFDQDPATGWRSLPADKQIKALRSYIEGPAPGMKKKHPDGKRVDKNTMTWHLGQALAMKGKVEEAISWMNQSLTDADDDPQWNRYIKATIAFLERRKQSRTARLRNRSSLLAPYLLALYPFPRICPAFLR
jgi:hypothetical protein